MAKSKKVTLDPDLTAMLAGWREPGWRYKFGDFLDERFPATPVELHELPKGFYRWWLKNKFHRLPGLWTDRGSFCIREQLRCFFSDAGCHSHVGVDQLWLDHHGSTIIGGHSVFVSEPYLDSDLAATVCDRLQQVLSCPVSLSYATDWAKPRIDNVILRIGIWFACQ